MQWHACILADCADPIDRLAAESALFQTLPPGGARLMLWRSVPSVVIGKNQNPWRECNPERIEADGGVVARRQSGGGAVYHDAGNLCYSIMVPKAGYCPDAVGERICTGLRRLGIGAQVGDRHVLEVDGQKISGTAFCHKRDRVLHHGTLLLSADLDRLRRWLEPSVPELETRAVASVPSPIINLQAIQPSLTMTQLIQTIKNSFDIEGDVQGDEALVEAERQRFSTDDWRFGLTPPFSLSSASGEIAVRKGRIQSAPPSLEHLLNTYFEPKLLSHT